MAVSYLDCTSAIGMGTYLTSMSGYFFSKSWMISFQTAVRGPPLLSQKVISPLPLPSPPLALPSSPHAVAVRASTAARETAAVARPRCVFEMFMIGSSLSVLSGLSVGARAWGVGRRTVVRLRGYVEAGEAGGPGRARPGRRGGEQPEQRADAAPGGGGEDLPGGPEAGPVAGVGEEA